MATSILTELVNEINFYMSEEGITRDDLAKRMGVSAGRLTLLLSGSENITLDTIESIVTALGARFEVSLFSTRRAVRTY